MKRPELSKVWWENRITQKMKKMGMTREEAIAAIRLDMAVRGSIGGSVVGEKGFAAMPDEKFREIQLKGSLAGVRARQAA